MIDFKSKLSEIKFRGSHFEIKDFIYGDDKFYGYELSLKQGLWKIEVKHRHSRNQLEKINLYLNDKVVIEEKYICYDDPSEEQMLEALKDALEKFATYIEEVEIYFTKNKP